MKTCLIIAGGPLDIDFAKDFMSRKDYDIIIAADAGLESMDRMDLNPTVVVGDFDSVSRETIDRFIGIPGIEWDAHNPEKDETDMELALRVAERRHCNVVDVLGAIGGRMDHTLTNIHLLYPFLKEGIQVQLWDEKNRIYLLEPELQHNFNRRFAYGTYISFIPLTQEVKGINLRGFKYPLEDRDISVGTSLCISNQLAGREGTAVFSEGVLICVESRD